MSTTLLAIIVLNLVDFFFSSSSDCRAAPPADQKDGENIQRAQRERDLDESNARDLEY